jgi:hypothetical protein
MYKYACNGVLYMKVCEVVCVSVCVAMVDSLSGHISTGERTPISVAGKRSISDEEVI